ncbi:MAG TPA: cytochrome-c oxidase, cbb3-type subunit III [Nevskiaceae bacterium]|nr:cytochrome-c oxidase, cbb3-type subunit III [Nevskiaceae bacterium]
MSVFWHWFVVVVTIASIIGSMWLLLGNSRRKGDAPGDTGHVWDGDLKELNNPLPKWWFNLFVLTVVFGIGYLVVFPGLGNFPGRAGWTQESERDERLHAILAKHDALYATFKRETFEELVRDSGARSIGRDVFLRNCAGCHGTDARGALGFPNLTDGDWLYGGKPEDILASITNGRRGQMPAFLGALSAQQADDLEMLVKHWSDPDLDRATRERAMQQFNVTCAACHGADGKGNQQLGSANLTDDVWLHGGSRNRIHDTIVFGRTSTMPAHASILSADDIRIVGAYVYGLSHANESAANP